MFTPETETERPRESYEDRIRRQHREQALDHAVKLAVANAGYTKGVPADVLITYAAKMATFLDEGATPTPDEPVTEGQAA